MSTPADDRSPDHSTCRHCNVAISWDDDRYTHDDTGFGDCGVVLDDLAGPVTFDPTTKVDPAFAGSRAEPVEWSM